MTKLQRCFFRGNSHVLTLSEIVSH